MKNLLLAPFYVIFGLLLIFGNLIFSSENYSLANLTYSISSLYPLEDRNKSFFNLANSKYRQEEYSEAIELLSKVIESTSDDKLKVKAHYNLGNNYFQVGAKALLVQDYDNVINFWLAAIDEYKKDLAINPEDTEAQENIDYILSLLEKLAQNSQSSSSNSSSNSDVSDSDVKEIEEKEKENREHNKEQSQYDGEYIQRDYTEPYW